MRTYLGRPEFGSWTRQKAYITFPLFRSSINSSSPPSETGYKHGVSAVDSFAPDYRFRKQGQTDYMPTVKFQPTHIVFTEIRRKTKLTSLCRNANVITIPFICEQSPVDCNRLEKKILLVTLKHFENRASLFL